VNNRPIFLKAIPRSGGTLFVTMMDAHPDIAMSYEIYEDRLLDDNGKPFSIESILRWYELCNKNETDDVKIINSFPENNFRIFLFRARRSGLNLFEMIDILRIIFEEGGTFDNSTGRLNFIDALMQKKMEKQKKNFWGGKTKANLYKLHYRYPNACFFIMKRDVRDVFASMKSKGNFNYTAKETAELWKNTLLNFRKFVSKCKPKSMEICYEKLASEPKDILVRICSIVGVNYDQEMLLFHKKKLTLFQNPHGQLSADQLKKGLNKNSIGRWKNELSVGDLNSIRSVTGDLINADAENYLP
jgi:hypothetical protein